MGRYVLGGEKPKPEPKPRKKVNPTWLPKSEWPARIWRQLGDREMLAQDLVNEVHELYGGNPSTIRTFVFRMQKDGRLKTLQERSYDRETGTWIPIIVTAGE